MKIVFCYIKNYKKLKEFQINFLSDSKFNLIIPNNETDSYILEEKQFDNKQPENFYGENISNITGIIGENGTGKSTILEVLFREIIDTQNKKIGNKRNSIAYKDSPQFSEIFIIFETDDKEKKKDKVKEYYSTLKNNVVFNDKTITEKITSDKNFDQIIKNYKKNISYLYIDDIFTRKKFGNEYVLNFQNETKDLIKLKKYDYSASSLIENNSRNILSYANSDLKRVVNLLIRYQWKKLDKELNLNVPKELYLSLGYNLGVNSIETFYENLIKDCFYSLKEVKDSEKKYIKNSVQIKKFEKFKKSLEFEAEKILKKVSANKDLTNFYPINSKEVDKFWDIKTEKIFELLKKLSEELCNNIFFKDNSSLIDKGIGIINFYIYLYYPYSQGKYVNFEMSDNGEIKINLNGNSNYDVKIFLNYFNYTSLSECLGYHFNIQLSSGEKSLLTLLSKLYEVFYINKSKNDRKWIIFLDEPENMMHPEWQRVILNIIIEFINNRVVPNFKSQIIVTSHSPYLASDLPRENLIMLKDKIIKKDDEANKTNNKKNKENEKIVKVAVESLNKTATFASNIYDLQAHSFFMKSPLGEFSKIKIEKIIKFLNGNESSLEKPLSVTEIEYVINSIGEPLIQNRLRSLYSEYQKKNQYNFKSILTEFEKMSDSEKIIFLQMNNFTNGDSND